VTLKIHELFSQARWMDLEQPRFAGMPIHESHLPGYFYALHRRHSDTYQPDRQGPRSGASGVLTMMEHSGTHIDALCHQACDLVMFGGRPVKDNETPRGFRELGAETIPPLLTRGVLLDVARAKGVPRLPEGYAITAEDLAQAAQGVSIQNGDVLLVRTGFGAVWDDAPLCLKAAGIAKSGTLWAADHGVAAVGADNMAWDVPSERDPETGATLFAHVYLLPQKGIYILENLYLEELSATGRQEFGFICLPLKLKGATGSPVRPLAVFI
jgi:kynurenine formamidase